MNKTAQIVIAALIIGGIIGYSFGGNKPVSKPATQEKAMVQPEVKKNSKEWKIQNAMSAATEVVSKKATVLDWPAKDGGDFVTLRKGTNDWTCLPDDPTTPGNDPACVDKTAMQWFQAYMTKSQPNIAQAGLAYMLQGGASASNTDPFATKPAKGESWMNAPAHIMIFPTGKLDPQVYGTDAMHGGPWIMWAGTPYEHLMVPVK